MRIFACLGLVTDEPDYKLCWMINRSLAMNFEKEDDLQLFHPKLKEEQVFSLFSYHDDELQ